MRGIDLHIPYEELEWGSADVAMSLMLTGLPFSFIAAARKTGFPYLLGELRRLRRNRTAILQEQRRFSTIVAQQG